MRDFRFGFNFFDIRSREDFIGQCRRGEAYGYDVALVPDHLGPPPRSRRWSRRPTPPSGCASARWCSTPGSGTRTCWPARSPRPTG